MSTWPLRDIIFAAMIVFNIGAVIGMTRYAIKRIERDLKEMREAQANLFRRMSEVEQVAAHNKGRLNGKK